MDIAWLACAALLGGLRPPSPGACRPLNPARETRHERRRLALRPGRRARMRPAGLSGVGADPRRGVLNGHESLRLGPAGPVPGAAAGLGLAAGSLPRCPVCRAPARLDAAHRSRPVAPGWPGQRRADALDPLRLRLAGLQPAGGVRGVCPATPAGLAAAEPAG